MLICPRHTYGLTYKMNFNHKFRNKKGANDMGENISNGTLYDRVEEKRGSLSKKELETAEYMAAHQEQLIYSSITDLAERAGAVRLLLPGSAGNWDTGGFRH